MSSVLGCGSPSVCNLTASGRVQVSDFPPPLPGRKERPREEVESSPAPGARGPDGGAGRASGP